jgi:ABC-2 type transport system permease protein
MNPWKAARVVAHKEVRHLRHDPYTLFLVFAVPLAAFLLFGYALETRVRDLPTAVQNLDNGRYSRELMADFSQSPVFELSAEGSSERDLLDALRAQRVKVAIQIPAGYSEAVFYGRPVTVRVWVDGSDAVLAGQAVHAARAIGVRHAIRIAFAGTGIEAPIEVSTEALYNPDGRPANYFTPALCALFGETTTLLLVALSIAKERERGTLDQLRITSIPLPSLIAGKLLACAWPGVAVSAILIVLMQAVFRVPIAGNLGLLAVSLLALQGPAMGLGLVLTAEARNQSQALQLSYFVFLPSVLLSGLIFPRETMPAAAKLISDWIPATWSTQLVRGIVLRGATWQESLPALGALTVLALLLIGVGSWRLRARLN